MYRGSHNDYILHPSPTYINEQIASMMSEYRDAPFDSGVFNPPKGQTATTTLSPDSRIPTWEEEELRSLPHDYFSGTYGIHPPPSHIPPFEFRSPAPLYQEPARTALQGYGLKPTAVPGPPAPGIDPMALSLSQANDIAHNFGRLSLSKSTAGRSTASSAFRLKPEPDLESESEDDTGDDEYLPSSSPSRKDRARVGPYDRRQRPTGIRSSQRASPRKPISSSSSSSASSEQFGGHERPRNEQASFEPEEREKALRDPSVKCPACGFVPQTGRVPDLKRHMETHQASVSYEKWVCCGVPTTPTSWSNERGSYVFRGVTMQGGCMRRFTRKDALLRHLKNDNLGCAGNADQIQALFNL